MPTRTPRDGTHKETDMQRNHVHFGEMVLSAVTAVAALSMLFIIIASAA